MCFRVIVTKLVPSQESERSYICVLGVSLPSQESERSHICVLGVLLPSQESERSNICVLGVSLPSLCKARRMRGHIFVF